MKLAAMFLLFSVLTSASLCVQPWPVDPERAKRVPVVLRVQLVHQGEGSKYLWPEVELIAVIKNESSYTFPKRFEVAVLSHVDMANSLSAHRRFTWSNTARSPRFSGVCLVAPRRPASVTRSPHDFQATGLTTRSSEQRLALTSFLCSASCMAILCR